MESDEQRDTIVKITVSGIVGPTKATIHTINENTKEKIEIDVSSYKGYECECSINYGSYIIEKISVNSNDYEASALTEKFVVSKDLSNEIIIEAKSKDISGTFAWFWANNGFTIAALAASCVALLVVKLKKNRGLAKNNGGMK